MRLTLLVPGLLLPREVLSDTVFDLTAPALSMLLGRARREAATGDWLPAAFGLDDLPAAALRKVGAGGTANGPLLCLDPVHWEIGRDGILLADPARLGLDAGEAASLIGAVQPLFAHWGELSASAPACWELQLSRPLELETRPLPDVIGAPVDPALPGGPDGREWRRLLAEVQTVLHAHPANQRREDQGSGRPTVNSLWPWGPGSSPQTVRSDFSVCWSDDPVLAGLCALADIPCIAPPEQFRPASGNVLCRTDTLLGPARSRDILAWRAALLALERDWIAPAVKALRKGECGELRLIGSGVHELPRHITFSLDRTDLWRFWRRPARLDTLA